MLYPLFFLIFRGRHAVFFLKIFTEILGVVETHAIGYLRYIKLTFAQVLGRPLKPEEAYELYRAPVL